MTLDKKITIICGHYGSGKTNIAVNLALRTKKSQPNKRVALADLDTVNPYFRAADNSMLLKNAGVEVLVPEFANSNVDIPAIPAGINELFDIASPLCGIIDVGGDDGAAVLGMYSRMAENAGYDMLYVVNMYRPLTASPSDALECMREIEFLSSLRCTGLINNSSLGALTTARDIADSIRYAHECAALCSLPLLGHSYVPGYAPDTPQLFPDEEKRILFPISDVTKKLF